MVKFLYGMLLIFALTLTTATFMVGCAAHHQIVFLNDACIKPFKRYDYHTCEKMRVSIDGKTYIIPKNFKTDLASIPRPLWSFLAPQYSGFVAAAILHDYLYRCHALSSRKFADEVLYSSLRTHGVTAYTATSFYLAVRLFGSHHFGINSETCGRESWNH